MKTTNVLIMNTLQGDIRVDSILGNPDNLARLEELMTGHEAIQAAFECKQLRITFTTKAGSKITLVSK